MVDAHLDAGGRILTVRVPMTFTTRGGRKLVAAYPFGSGISRCGAWV